MQELAKAMRGAWGLLRGDAAALDYFDLTTAGALRSFRAAVLIYPIWLGSSLLEPGDAGQHADWIHGLVLATIFYVISWTAFPLLMLPISRFLEVEDRWTGFVTVRNWSQVPQTVSVLLMLLLLTSAGPGASSLLAIIVVPTILFYQWNMSRISLGISGLAAFMVILLNLVLDLSIAVIRAALG